MRGFVRQRGTTYTAYWETRDPATGKRRQHTKGGFRTRRDAQRHLASVLGAVVEGRWTPDQPLTVRQLLADHWIPAQRSRGLRPSTLAQYQGAIEWYLVPALGAKKVAALTPADVSSLVERLRTTRSATGREGLSERTVQVAVSVLKAATKWAARNGIVSRDPLVGVERPRVQRAEMRTWDEEQARQFLASVRGDRLEAAWVLFLTRGLRRGELAGLKWDAVDLANESLAIVSTLLAVDGKPVPSQPKTASGRRSIPLDDKLVALLRSHEKAQKAERLRAGEAWESSGFVFCDELGRPYHPDFWGDRFDALVKAADLPRIRLHDLRHTAFSLMAKAGVPLKVIQELAGHSTPAITMSLYVHTVPSMARDAGERLSATLLG